NAIGFERLSLSNPQVKPQARGMTRSDAGGADPQRAADALGQIPVPAPEELHRGRDENRPDDRAVEPDRARQAQPELLQPDEAAGHEPDERGHHDDRRRGDDPAGVL